MANTTSGTTTFEKTFYIDKIIEEAYERIGRAAPRTGQDLESTRRSLNIMFQEWFMMDFLGKQLNVKLQNAKWFVQIVIEFVHIVGWQR